MKRTTLLLAACLLASVQPAAAQGMVLYPAGMQFFDNTTGAPLAGGLLYTCVVGSACPGTTQATWQDVGLSVPNGASITLNGAGRLPNAVYASGATYKLVLESSTGGAEFTVDNVPSPAGYNVPTLPGTTLTYQAATVLTLASNTVTPTRNVHALDTAGGAQNLNTISTTNVAAPFVLYLSANNPGANPVTVTAAGNVSLSAGSFTLNSTSSWLVLILKGTTWYELSRTNGNSSGIPFTDDFRLSLTTATCVTTTDVTAATTLFFTPCTGNRITLFDSSGNVETCTTAEISIAVPATTSQMYDIWAKDSTFGTCTVALELLAWTNDTTRATTLTRANGRWTKTGDTSRLYVGSFRTTGVSGQTEDSLTKRYAWNYYNRVPRVLRRLETTGSWTYTTATFRQANNSALNQVEAVLGIADAPISLQVYGAATDNAGGTTAIISIGEDSTTVADALVIGTYVNLAAAATIYPISCAENRYPTAGYHKWVWLEKGGGGGGTTTWEGTNTGQSGINARIDG